MKRSHSKKLANVVAKGKKRERSWFSSRLGRKKKKTLADKPYHSKIEEFVNKLTFLTLPSGGSTEGVRTGLLFLDQGQKMFFWGRAPTAPPPYLRVWMTETPVIRRSGSATVTPPPSLHTHTHTPSSPFFALATIVRAPLHLNAYFAGSVQKEEKIRLRDQAALPVVYIAEHCRPRSVCKGTSTAAGVVSKSLMERTWQQVWPCVVWWAGCWDDLDILVE